MFAGFEAENPGIKIEPVEFASDEYPTVVTTQLSGKQNFDIVFSKSMPDISGLINQGHLKPITQYIADTPTFDEAKFSGLLEYMKSDGEVYGLPFRKDNYLLYYNKDLFDAAGVEYPTDGMTLDEYADLAERMTSGTGNEKVYGAHFHIWPAVSTNIYRRLEQYQPFDTSTYDIQKPLYKWLLDLQDRGIIMDYGMLESTKLHYSGVFYNEQAAMIQIGTWFTNMLLENATFNWDAVSLPNDDKVGNTVGVGGITPVSLGAYGDHPDEAWTVLQYICGEGGAVSLAKSGVVPGYSSTAVNDIFDAMPDNNEFAPANFSRFIDLPKFVPEAPMDPHGAEIDRIQKEQHSAIMTKSVSVDEGLAKLVERVQAAQNK